MIEKDKHYNNQIYENKYPYVLNKQYPIYKKIKEKAGKCRLTLKTYFDEISFAYALIRKLRRFNIRDRKMKVDAGRL